MLVLTLVLAIPVTERKQDDQSGDPCKVDHRKREAIAGWKLRFGAGALKEVADVFSSKQTQTYTKEMCRQPLENIKEQRNTSENDRDPLPDRFAADTIGQTQNDQRRPERHQEKE